MAEDNNSTERLLGKAREVRRDVNELRQELGRAAGEMKTKLDFADAVQAHPIRTVLIAAGVGYVLGGGLFSRFTRRLVGTGLRLMVLPMAKAQLENMLVGSRDTMPAGTTQH